MDWYYSTILIEKSCASDTERTVDGKGKHGGKERASMPQRDVPEEGVSHERSLATSHSRYAIMVWL
jgi:hypothetical protein